MSFFDEADEPERPPRAAPRRPRSSGRPRPSGRPPGGNQQIQNRRIVAIVAILIVVVVMAIVIHGCESSQTQSSLRDYSTAVYSLIDDSNKLGKEVFATLRGAGSRNLGSVQTKLNRAKLTAASELTKAKALNAPAQMSTAQKNLELVMAMRENGIGLIAANIQPALSKSTAQDGVNQIAIASSYLYGSDTVYKGYVGPEIAKALSAAGVAAGGNNSVQINPGQIVPDLGWLIRTNIATWVGATLPTNVANSAGPGKHGHSLNEVLVGTAVLSPTSVNQVTSSPAPTFQLNITNGGTTPEYDVECEVIVHGLSDTGTATLPRTTPGQTTNCAVTLPQAPTPGTYKVTAEVVPVPGETLKKNNKITYSIQFG